MLRMAPRLLRKWLKPIASFWLFFLLFLDFSVSGTISSYIVSKVFFRYIIFNIILESNLCIMPFLKTAPFSDKQTQNACILRLLIRKWCSFCKNEKRSNMKYYPSM